MPPQTPDPLKKTPASNPDPAPTAAAAPAPTPYPSASAHVDLEKIVLPKKPGTPSVDSAQRVNAGVLFEQERTATLVQDQSAKNADGNSSVGQAIAAPKEDVPLVRALQTYQSDIEGLVQNKDVSVVTIAAAEANRRGMSKLEDSQAPLTQGTSRPWLRNSAMVVGGLLLLTMAGGVGYYIYERMQPVSIAEQSPAPFIRVDETTTVRIATDDSRRSIMQALTSARDGVSLSLGLVARIQVVTPTDAADGSLQEVEAPELLPLLAPTIPQQLVRTLEPQMLLGVHSYDQNQTFMILKTNSYETAYAGLLAWETTMQQDLSPLFTRAPGVRVQNQALPAALAQAFATSSPPSYYPPSPASTSAPIGSQPPTYTTPPPPNYASTTPPPKTPATPVATPLVPPNMPSSTVGTTSAPASTTTPPMQFSQGNFIDQIVENQDTRAILDQDGNILLLWTMLDRSTIIITTNDATLREIISRISQTSILSLPQRQ